MLLQTPNTPANQERLEWLATAIRGFKGEASVLQVLAIDDLPSDALKEQFREERKPDYTALIRELQQLKPTSQGFSTQLARLKRRFVEIVEIDFFECPLKTKGEEALYKAEHSVTTQERAGKGRVSKMEYQNRAWITRPRPGIDRVSSFSRPGTYFTCAKPLPKRLRTHSNPIAPPYPPLS
ncbi:MAG: hypothetical protein JWQ49_1642 [Edaphobacter sp.]|nr:hypothetical protein [Edaphobacter sp.]